MPGSPVPFWRNEKILLWLGQITFLLAILAFFWFLFANMAAGLQKQGIALGLSFLNATASFDIAETPIPYSRTDSYLRAFQVGLLNTLQVSIIGIVFYAAGHFAGRSAAFHQLAGEPACGSLS